MTITSTVTTKGQVTIPQVFREMLGIEPGQRVEFHKKDQASALVMKPVTALEDMQGFFKTNKKFDKRAARKAYMKDVLAGKI